MGKRYRCLDTNRLAEPFVREILGYSDDESVQEAIEQIIKAEIGIDDATKYPTITHTDFRDIPYVDENARLKLRKDIFTELISQVRLENDDDIRLGAGGALPKSPIKRQGSFSFIIGLPASGKSFLANRICDKTGSLLLDSDYAKRKLPEYSTRANGASLVHKESQVIIMGDPNNKKSLSVFEYCLSQGINMVYPCIGNKLNEIIELTERIKVFKYKSHLILVDLDRLKATKRAYNRYIDTDRYIPLSKIYDDYANDPIISYYRAKQKYTDLFESFGQVDTDVDLKLRYKIIEKTKKSPLTKYRQKKASVKGGDTL